MGKGYVHIYTGNGKGKTTAATGLALRAVGAGKKVLFTQFMKTGTSSEQEALKKFRDLVVLRWYGTGEFVGDTVRPDQFEAARNGLTEVTELLAGGTFELVVLDESITCLTYGLLTVRQLLDLLEGKPETAEIVLTGRGAPPPLINAADLVTEMVEVKHYFNNGVTARRGIEF